LGAGRNNLLEDGFWTRLDALADRAPSIVDLLDHRLGAVAARHWRAQGRPLAPAVVEEERYATLATVAAPILLKRVASLYERPIMVLKGPEVAARYPEASMRPSHDLDLLVEDSAGAFRALIAAGCSIVRERPSRHHEMPVAFPDLPLIIELHSAPKWPTWNAGPSAKGLFAVGVPSHVGPPGVLAPRPAEHAVLLAAHSWAHRPLARVLDFVDILVLLAETDTAEADEVARRWHVPRLWDTTLAAARALFSAGETPWTLRTWAKNTLEVRRPTRSEELLERFLSPFAALPPRRALRVAGASAGEMLIARSTPSRRHSSKESRTEHPAFAAARERSKT
jgi:hypothetical protein